MKKDDLEEIRKEFERLKKKVKYGSKI